MKHVSEGEPGSLGIYKKVGTYTCFFIGTTVDGSEMRRSPVEFGTVSHYLQGFSTIPGGCLGFLPSTMLPPLKIKTWNLKITKLKRKIL